MYQHLDPAVVISSEKTKSTSRLVKCPRCKDDDCTRIPRGFFIRTLFPTLPIRHFICNRCQKRFYRRCKQREYISS